MAEAQTPIGFHEDGSFRFHVPFKLKKGSDGKHWIEGVASVEKEDITGETVILAGMDLTYLLSRGYLNDNHGKTTDAKVGVPTEALVTPDGLKVKGYLFDTPRAKGILELAEALKKSGSDRRLGFSVEGKTLKRDGKIVKQSWIKDIAITAEPVNPYTYMDVIKGISADIAANGYVDLDKCADSRSEPLSYWDRMEQVFTRCLGKIFGKNAGKESVLPLEKMLEAGAQVPAETGGSALRKESLEPGVTNLDLPQEGGKELTETGAVQMLIDRGYSEAAAKRIVGMLFDPAYRNFLVNAKS